MELALKTIDTKGIFYIEPLDGSRNWYWGMDYTSGDLYEAEELYRMGHAVDQNRIVFVRCPDGRTIHLTAGKGRYFGRPVCYEDRVMVLRVDFPAGKIEILRLDESAEQLEPHVELPLSETEDCYNLLLRRSPLMLTRQGQDGKFQILWPEKTAFEVGNTESFHFRRGEGLYFSAWYEDPDYREETILRDLRTGEVRSRTPGALWNTPDGQMWLLV